MEQIERAKRYLERIRKIYGGTALPWEERICLQDDVISFFMHCYHIKDWIIELSRVKVTPQEINEFINKHEALKICADLCNGSKHCQLTRTPKTGQQPHIVSSQYQTGSNNESVFVKGRFSVLSNQEFHDALELAEECMALWNAFIADLQTKYNQKIEENNITHLI